ncbi:Alpha-glucosidase [Hymenobacter roseosalivarius DSM 11622]|uniref:Alpha-glucosidase n=1 Tax=Hymenobacter roseosalivarius DSM 11622 TaxID=645990 RepID=A0A1W1VBB5_9BACT|nr:TIM-barrel domain-containing protein [Hymenobacter roseosalivarius]SMB90652.1 Alpha-glucosidase [Hymenobacter roseosalivarius DSM 11622]
MQSFFRFSILPLLAVLSLRAYGQREADGPPTQDPFPRPAAPAQSIAAYRSHQYSAGQLSIRATDGATLRVRPWATGVVRIEYFPAGSPVRPDSSVSVVTIPAAGLTTGVRASSQALTLDLTENLQVVVSKKPLRVHLLRGLDTLASEAWGAFRRVATGSSGPGSVGVGLRLQPGEQLYGTGARALPLDRRGRRLELYNQARYGYQNGTENLNLSLPVVVSSRGYAVFFDNHTAGYLDLGATTKNVLEYGGESLRSLGYFLVAGDSYATILDRYTALTGRQPLPPRWALGLIQSRFGYRSQAETEAVAGRMRREGFPLDALVLDLYWFGTTKDQGNLDWNYQKFPKPAAMMRGLDSIGVKTILISEPYVMRASRNDSTVRTQGLIGTDSVGRPFTVASFWAGPASLLDMFKPSARQWLWSYYKKRKMEGVGGWWSDLGEPENHPEQMHHVLGPTRQVHNAYGQAWASIFAENYPQEYPQERLFNLARSGWAGMQRNSVFPWSGDINRSWSGFQAQIPIMLSVGMGGVGYMHSDAGGFCVGPIDPELYTRWLQMAALCPIMRPHGEGVPPEPYYYPEPYKSIVRTAARQRYELLPYLYTLAWENSQSGAPLVRPMNYEATGAANEQLGNVNDQYLLGPNLLVAPVVQPAQRRRNVQLPAGTWIDFYTHETLAGGQIVGRNAPLEHVPLLVRAGAFLPLAPYVNTTARYHTDTLRVRFYADYSVPRSSFTLYEDDGKSAQALAGGQFQLLTFAGTTTAAQTDIRLTASDQGYAQIPPSRVIELLLPRVVSAPTAVLVAGQPAPADAWRYEAASQTLHVQTRWQNQPLTISIQGLRLPSTASHAAPEPLTLGAPSDRVFGSQTTLNYTLHTPGQYPLTIRDTRGQVVRTFALASTPGEHSQVWNANDQNGQPLPNGVYTAQMLGQHQRLVLLRPN